MTWYKTLKHFDIILKDFFWFIDSTERKKRSIQAYLKRNTNIALMLVNQKKLPFFKLHLKKPDVVMKKIYDWVCDNYDWVSDQDNYNKVEKWEDLDIAIDKKGIDCETMATLIYCLAKLHKVNPLMLYFVVGKVQEGYGHAWLEYLADSGNYKIIDAAYAPNLKLFKLVSKDKRYIERWYKTTFII